MSPAYIYSTDKYGLLSTFFKKFLKTFYSEKYNFAKGSGIMIIRTNGSSLRAMNARNKTTREMSKNLEKLSSGFRINRAADDVAGLSISESMRAQITELSRCQNNIQEGINLAQTADAALEEVNTMLRRAHSLCVQAQNGTYGELERDKFSDEMNQLFEEIDRITAGTKFNSIPLFRGEIYEDYYYERVENFDKLPPGEFATWGEMTFIKSEDFDPAPKAQPATTTFTLADSIDLNDINTLEGKSIKIGDITYLFSSMPDASDDAYHSSITKTTKISLKTYDTVEKALKAIKDYPKDYPNTSSTISEIGEVEIDGRTVTLTAKLKPLSYTVKADGRETNYSAPDGDAECMNDKIVQNALGDASIFQVDNIGAVNNQPTYSETVTGTISLEDITGALNQKQVDNLLQNKLVFRVNSSDKRTIDLNTLNPPIKVNMTKEELGKALATAISGTVNGIEYTANYNSTTQNLDVSVKAPHSTIPYNATVSFAERVVPDSGGKREYGNKWTSAALGINIQTIPSTQEVPEKTTITIPSNLDIPLSFRLGNGTYLYYDSSKNPLTHGDYDNTSYSGYTNYPTTCDMKGKSADEIKKDILSKIQNYAQGRGGTVTISGNTLNVTANNIGDKLNLSSNVYGEAVNVSPYKFISGTGGTNSQLGASSTFTRETELSFDLGNPLDINKLIGKGFSIAVGDYYTYTYRRYEFTNGSAGQHGDYTDIDISACTDYNSLQKAIQQAMSNTSDAKKNPYKVSIDNNGIMKIAFEKDPRHNVYVTDGAEGIMADSPAKFSGGKNVGYSHKELDFSSITSDNVETLLGKGFRINCATCAGEYINVFFCWENDGTVPLKFERLDEETGEMRTIHNIPVELSKITSGDKIVEDIVRQVSPSLNHYTAVEVGEPPTTLIARDKRRGEIKDFNDPNKFYIGKVQTGVESNFVYDTFENEDLILPGGENSVGFHNSEVKIFVGSEPEPQFIPIHLPYLDLTYLRLNPPEVVDLNDPEQDATDWLTRVDDANMAIALARGILGTDYNRLEYSFNELASYEENLTSSESLIRDANMAHEMMNQVKLEILTQAQQAMLSQANVLPQQVLQLLQ